MSNAGERLRQERMRLDMSQEAFGAAGGVKKVAQSNYETGKRYPDSQYLERISSLGVDIQYVISGIRSDNSSSPGISGTAEGSGHHGIPMYDIEAAAGAGRSLDQEPIEGIFYFPTDQLSDQGLVPDKVVGIKVRGDSMESTLSDGDWVLVDRSCTDPRHEGVFLLLVSGERRIKRVQRLAGGALYLISDNEHYQPEMIRPEQMREVEILGRCEVRIGKIF